MFRRIVCSVLLSMAAIAANAHTAKAQWTLWQIDCDGRWLGVKNVWYPYTNTDSGGKYGSQSQALQVAQGIQNNYQSQGYKLSIGTGQGNNPSVIYYNGKSYGRNQSPCSSGGGTQYVPPKCTPMWAVIYYYRGATYSTGYAYTSQSAANYVASYFRQYGIPASVPASKCVYPGQ